MPCLACEIASQGLLELREKYVNSSMEIVQIWVI